MKTARPEAFTGKRVGLALGGGSARGVAHMGVIEALHEAGVFPQAVAGVSIGAVVGAFYAAERIDVLRKTVESLDWRQLLRFFGMTFPRSGLVDGRRIADFIREKIGARGIEDLELPFAAVATDLADGAEVLMRDGDVVSAVRASLSVPGIFTPVLRDGRLLGDGGLANPVPVNAARALGADVVIAVDLNHDIAENKGVGRRGWFGVERENVEPGVPSDSDRGTGLRERLNQFWDTLRADRGATAETLRMPNIFEVIMAAVVIMTKQITDAQLEADPPELLIQPKLGHINFFEFNRAEEAFAEGRRAAREALFEAGFDVRRG